MQLTVGDIVETPYGPGVVIETHPNNNCPAQSLTISVSGTDYRIKQIGLKAVGHIDMD